MDATFRSKNERKEIAQWSKTSVSQRSRSSEPWMIGDMNTHQEPQAPDKRTREFTLQAQLNLSATGAALAKRNEDLDELDRIARGEDPPDNED